MEDSNKCLNCSYRSSLTEVLSDGELGRLSKSCSISSLKKNEYIANAGSFQSNLVYLRSGFVSEFLRFNGEDNQIIQIIKRGNYIGLNSLFTQNTYQSSFKALSDIELCYIEKNSFISLIKDNGKFALEILRSSTQNQLNNYNRYVDITRKQVYGKVAEVLLYLSDIVFESEVFPNLLTQAEIAQMLFTSRESVSRIFAKLKEEGFIKIESKTITLSNKKRLKELSNFT
jgi:CRP/FNR family transcriptional regulator